MSRTGEHLLKMGVLLLATGAIVIVVGLIMNSFETGSGGTASFGGVVLIGPIPIVFGTDRTALLIGVVGALILMAVWFAFYYTRTRRIVLKTDSSA
jgi:uncharacterized protein (TIGR00304 family)